MKVFLDTNVFLRFYIPEAESIHRSCVELISLCQQGKIRPYTSHIVLLELIFVLTKLYGHPKGKVLEALDDLLALRNLTVIDRIDTKKALEFYRKFTVKIGDCYIASQIPEGVIFCTYDADFRRFSHLQIQTPEEILAKL